MRTIPRDPLPDGTLGLLSEGYRFISNRCRRFGTDLFRTRLMLTPAVCMMGEEAARVFYEVDRFTRRGAVPTSTLTLLQDKGSVQTLDGGEHRWQKRMFMSLMTPDTMGRLADRTASEWRRSIVRRRDGRTIVLLDETEAILCRATCAWAGISLADEAAAERTRELSAMIDGAGAFGPRNWRGQILRRRTERWAEELIRHIRMGELDVDEDGPLGVIARHRDEDGVFLPENVAAVELLNLLRPTVAIARYVVFAALALHEHPSWRERIAGGDEEALHAFVQEVRRFFPFFPFVGGRVREPFEWRDHRFAAGDWVLLDLYGTDRDPRSWPEPEAFRPERFLGCSPRANALVPQGGGDHFSGHRCAGEWITIELIKVAVRMLTTGMRYSVPEQDLRVGLARMPARPASGFVIADVVPGTC